MTDVDFTKPFALQVQQGADGVAVDPEMIQSFPRGPVVRPGHVFSVLLVGLLPET